jgi:hypothetical protein
MHKIINATIKITGICKQKKFLISEIVAAEYDTGKLLWQTFKPGMGF